MTAISSRRDPFDAVVGTARGKTAFDVEAALRQVRALADRIDVGELDRAAELLGRINGLEGAADELLALIGAELDGQARDWRPVTRQVAKHFGIDRVAFAVEVLGGYRDRLDRALRDAARDTITAEQLRAAASDCYRQALRATIVAVFARDPYAAIVAALEDDEADRLRESVNRSCSMSLQDAAELLDGDDFAAIADAYLSPVWARQPLRPALPNIAISNLPRRLGDLSQTIRTRVLNACQPRAAAQQTAAAAQPKRDARVALRAQRIAAGDYRYATDDETVSFTLQQPHALDPSDPDRRWYLAADDGMGETFGPFTRRGDALAALQERYTIR